MSTKTIKVNQSRLIYKVDAETGEVIEELETTGKTEILVKDKGDEFFFGFMNGQDIVDNLSAYVLKLLYIVAPMCRKNHNTFSVNKVFYREVAKRMNVTEQRVKQLLASGVEQKGLIKEARALYMINPYIFWKGSMSSRFSVLNRLFNTERKVLKAEETSHLKDFEGEFTNSKDAYLTKVPRMDLDKLDAMNPDDVW